MTSEDDNPLHKQFLRVQREEDEDTWISGEELKTEGSSGSDDDAPRRKIFPRKSRRRRSEGYTHPESNRLSLPNLGDNKPGIALRVSRPEEKDCKSERFTVGGELCAEEEMMRMEAAMTRMSTRSSLEKTEQVPDLTKSDSEWRPKRGSLKLPNLEEEKEKKKVIRFSEEIGKIDPPADAMNSTEIRNFDLYSEDVNIGLEMTGEQEDTLSVDFEKWKESSMGFSDIRYEDTLDEDDIDRYVLKESDGEHWKPILKNKLKLPNFDGDNVDTSVKQFVSEMNDFYNEMSGKLRSLKDCPVLENSQNTPLDLEDEKFMEAENFKNLYKNLKKTPQVKKTLSLISKMDSDISETITKFREERAERLEIQKQLLNKIPKDRNSQLFLQLCEFESKSHDNLKRDLKEQRNEDNEARRRNRRHFDDKNFIERNKELAKVGMNFSLSDEQKQRLERILQDEMEEISVNDGNRLPSGVRRVNHMMDTSFENTADIQLYSNCTINAYRLSDEHKEKLIGIDSALKAKWLYLFNRAQFEKMENENKVSSVLKNLQLKYMYKSKTHPVYRVYFKAYEEDDSRQSIGTSIGVSLVKSLKEIDEKLKALSATYIRDEELLEKNRNKSIDIDRMEESVVQLFGNKTSTDSTTSTQMSI